MCVVPPSAVTRGSRKVRGPRDPSPCPRVAGGGGTGALRADRPRPRRRVARLRQDVERRIRMVAQERVPVHGGAPDRLDHHVQRLHRSPTVAGKVEVLEDVERLGHRGAAVGTGHRQNPVPPVAGLQHRVVHERPVRGQVLLPDRAAVRRHLGGDALGHLALVEAVRSVAGDELQRACVIALHHRLAHRRGVAAGEVRLPRRRVALHHLPAADQRQHEVVPDRESVARQPDRRQQRLVQAQRAPALQGRRQTRCRPRHRDRRVAVHVGSVLHQRPCVAAREPQPARLRTVGSSRQIVHVLPGRGGRAHAEVHRAGLARGEAGDQHPAAAHPVHERLQHAHREGGGHRRIHRVAAPLQDLRADARAQPVLGDHHTAGHAQHLVRQDRPTHLHGGALYAWRGAASTRSGQLR